MKTKIFSILVILIVSLQAWAQTPVKPELIVLGKEYHNIYPKDTPFVWVNDKPYSKSGIYRDTVRVDDITIPDTARTLVLNIKQYVIGSEEYKLAYPSETTFMWRGKLRAVMDTIYYDTLKAQFFEEADVLYSIRIVVKKYVRNPIPTVANIYQYELPYIWLNKPYTQTGVYYDTIKVPEWSEPDTITRLVLQVKEYVDIPVQKENIYPKDTPFVWLNKPYSATGIYYDTVKTGIWDRPDTAYTLDLQIKEYIKGIADTMRFYNTTTYFLWRGKQRLVKDTTYFDTLQASVFIDPDVVHSLTMVVKQYEYKPTVSDSIYPYQLPYIWMNKPYTHAGVYADTIKVSDWYDRDTICTLDLHVKTYEIEPQETAYIPPTQATYTWRNREWKVAHDTICFDTLKAGAFDSPDHIYSLHMIHKKYFSKNTVHDKTCQTSTPYYWRGHPYWETGFYYDTVLTTTPTDTVYMLKLSVGKPFEQLIRYSICQGEQVEYAGKIYTENSVDTIRYSTIYGCDSLIIVMVHVTANSFTSIERRTCQGEPYIWEKSSGVAYLTQQGYYYDSLKNINGCDSIVCLHLIMDKPHVYKDSIALCTHDLPYLWHGRYVDETGVYYDTVARGANQCDSIVRLAFTVLQDQYEEITTLFCTQQGATHKGSERFYKDTMCLDTLLTPTGGCYRIVRTSYLANDPFYLEETKHRTPDSVNYVWQGQVYTEDGNYTFSRPSEYGCDSIWVLHLKTDYHTYLDSMFCYGSTVFYKGIMITTDTTIVDSMVTKFGGDSVITINYKRKTAYQFREDYHICSNKPMPWPGHDNILLNGEGVYTDPYVSIEGCDSIYTAYVTISKPAIKDTTVYISRYHQKDSLPYKYYDRENVLHLFNRDTTIVDTLGTTADGCDSISSFALYVIESWSMDTFKLCANGSVVVDGQSYSKPGDYEHWLTKSSSSTYKDSIHYFHIDSIYNHYNVVWDSVVICQDELPYQWHSRVCMEAGVYQDTIPSSCGCDSTVILRLGVNPTYQLDSTINICPGETVHFHEYVFFNDSKHADTTVVDSAHTQHWGCDSIITYHIRFLRSHTHVETVHLGKKEYYVWYGDTIRIPGYYTKETPGSEGCVSDVYQLTLIADSTYHFYDTITICQNERFIWHDVLRQQSGDYTWTGISSQGMDSIESLHLIVIPSKKSYQTVHLCPGQGFPIGDTVFTTNGVYDYHTLSSQGCDSVVHLVVQVDPPYHFVEKHTILEGGSYKWTGHKGDIVFTKEGTYYDSLATVNGCDSIYELQLTINDESFDSQIIDACDGDTIRLLGKEFTLSGVFYDTTFTKHGYTKVTRYTINFHKAQLFTQYAKFCSNSSYQWRGHLNDTVITRSGTYYDRNYTAGGCDSTYVLYLTAIPSSPIHDTTIYVCSDELPFIYKGQEYYDSHEFKDTMINSFGCDSIEIVRLRVHNHCSERGLYTKCANQPITVDNYMIKADGEYRIPVGYDSIHRFRVQSYPTYNFTTYLTSACDSISYKDRTYYAHRDNDTIRDVFYWQSVHGCDSIEHITAVLYHSAVNPVTRITIPDYAYVVFDGRRYDESGTYSHKHQTIHGCDSTTTIELTITPTVTPGLMHVNYCSLTEEYLEVFGKKYHPSQDTTILDTIYNKGISIMTIQTAYIHVTQPFTITSIEVPKDICAGQQLIFTIRYSHTGSYPATYHLTFLDNQLVVSPNPQSGDINYKDYIDITMDGRGVCVAPGIYPYRLRFGSDNCYMSDTTIDGSITVRYPASIMEAFWDNTVALVNKDYNAGGWTFTPPYNWQIFNSAGLDKTALINPNQNLSYISSPNLVAGDIITVTPMRSDYATAITSCEFEFHPEPITDKVPVLVTPTMVPKRGLVRIQTSQSGSYTLYSATGMPCSQGSLIDGESSLSMPGAIGYYLLQIKLTDGTSKVERLIVY